MAKIQNLRDEKQIKNSNIEYNIKKFPGLVYKYDMFEMNVEILKILIPIDVSVNVAKKIDAIIFFCFKIVGTRK